MAEQNLFEELKAVLADFKEFLATNVAAIGPAIQAIASVVPQVNELIDLLIGLLDKLNAEIEKLDVGVIPGLTEFSELTAKVPAFLEAAKKILPGEAASIESIADVADVVTGLPSVGEVKVELQKLITDIKALLEQLKA